MPIEIMEKIISIRCREMDGIISFSEILPLYGNTERAVKHLSEFMVNVSNTLIRVPFSNQFEKNAEDMSFLGILSKRVLWALVRWKEKYPDSDDSLSKIAPMTSANSFIILSLSVIIQRKFSSLWWIVAFSEQFFNLLAENPNSTAWLGTVRDIIEDKVVVVT